MLVIEHELAAVEDYPEGVFKAGLWIGRLGHQLAQRLNFGFGGFASQAADEDALENLRYF